MRIRALKVLRAGAAFALLAAAPCPAGAEPGEDPAQEPPQAGCPGLQSEEIPAYYKRGFVTVPEDWENPGGGKIRVFYYGNVEDDGGTPVVFFNGGPGQSSYSSSSRFQTVEAAKNRTIIFLDQRGTGCSTPYPGELTAEAAARLANYGSRAIVRDAEAVRKKLFGDKKWKVFAQSYGGLIAHRYLAVAPEGVEGLFVHGFAMMSDWSELFKLRLLSQKRIAGEYFKKYPQDRARLESFRAQIGEEDCFSGESTRVCGPAVLDSFSMLLGLPGEWWQLHSALAGLADEDGALNKAALRRYAEGVIRGNLDKVFMPGAIIARMEMSDQGHPDQCAAALGLLEKEGYDLDDWPLNECRFFSSLSSIGETSQVVDVINSAAAFDPLLFADVQAGLLARPGLTIHLYSGGLDAYSPLEIFREETGALGGAVVYKNLPGTGHDGYYLEPEIWDDLWAAEGAAPPGSGAPRIK